MKINPLLLAVMVALPKPPPVPTGWDYWEPMGWGGLDGPQNAVPWAAIMNPDIADIGDHVWKYLPEGFDNTIVGGGKNYFFIRAARNEHTPRESYYWISSCSLPENVTREFPATIEGYKEAVALAQATVNASPGGMVKIMFTMPHGMCACAVVCRAGKPPTAPENQSPFQKP